jgi:hypothetical protein
LNHSVSAFVTSVNQSTYDMLNHAQKPSLACK